MQLLRLPTLLLLQAHLSYFEKRGIYLGYPPTMDPIPVNKRKRDGMPKDPGAPKHAVRGEALNKDG